MRRLSGLEEHFMRRRSSVIKSTEGISSNTTPDEEPIPFSESLPVSGEVGVRRGGVFKAFNSPLLNFQVVWIFCLTVLSLLVLLMPPLFYLFLSKKHGENLKKARA